MKFSLLIFFALLCVFNSRGQSSGSVVLLTDYLESLQKDYNLTFSYDAGLLKDLPFVAPAKTKNAKAAVQYLQEHTAFDYKIVNKKNVTIVPRFTGKNFLICGKVIDAGLREPMFGVVITDQRRSFRTESRDDGSFFFAIDYKSVDSLIVGYSGYKRRTFPVSYFVSGSCPTIYLQSEITELNEVMVVAYLTEGISYDALDNSISLSPRNQSILPGQNNGDILHSLDALPGISTPDSKAGNLNIRGSSSDQTLISFDQIPIYLKGHFFGTLSPFNSNLVDRINVQRSVMSADKGGRVGGAIEIASPSAVVNKFHGSLTSSLLDGALSLQVPIIKDRLSLSMSARASYPYTVKTPTYKAISDFIFQESEVRGLIDNKTADSARLKELSYVYDEYNAKVSAKLSDKHELALSMLYIQNRLVLERESNPANYRQKDSISLINMGASFSLISNWNSKFSTSLTAVASDYNQECTTNRATLVGPNGPKQIKSVLFQNRLVDSRIQAEGTWRFSKEMILKSGYSLHHHDVSYVNIGADSVNTSFSQNISQTGNIHSIYANLLGTPKARFSYNLGLRLNHFDLTGNTNIEPRLIFSYKVREAIRLKASGGYQKQFLTQVSGVSIESIGGVENQLWLLADNVVLPEVTGYQVAGGAIYQKSSWLIDVEGYYKQVNNISSISIVAPTAPDPYIHGEISTIGVDFLLRKQFKNLDAWMSYTISKSQMRFDSINKGEKFYSLFDQTHVLDLACSYRVKQWKFSLAWKLRTGLAALPGLRSMMLHGANSSGGNTPPNPGGGPVFLPGSATEYQDRYPMVHQLDASIYYGFPRKEAKWKGSAGISVMNCYNQQNIAEQIAHNTPQGPVLNNVYMLGITPNLFLNFSF